MDAANYISTLDSLDLLAQEPSSADFAIIDLAVDDRFLRFLYEADQHGSVQWWSLLENTRWQASWNQGPILLAFNGDTQFHKKLKEKLSFMPLGIVIDSPESSTCVFNWAQGWLLALGKSDERLFRFYDPRSFRPLLAAFAGREKQIISSGVTIYWHNGSGWHGYRSPDNAIKEELPEQPSLVQAELSELPAFRSADRAMVYEQVYRDYLPETGDRRVWVLEQLQRASKLGFETVSLQERWLRLCIRIGSDPIARADVQEVIRRSEMTPADRLNAMESILEGKDATA
ncbi:DUF4123 domain-containing protein [Marinobacter salsuginis]|jgi:hypothetical protein|uniref:DUF4123 domain-containing protein n=1 Tax=Marinobacter salsuginis TaxID=418719 RepID=A0A5M3Q2T0_9GAMM|nr:DUF4123 domain-containing protein [Marinobacter salsuginis]GBO85076.1 hypothetical protein MS5N3_25270 [Marinobacter salsuginis]GBO89513.1 hypothetical protein MSSD14B_31810 [Marinobacter salsuginis]|tara:strand:+ start:415 stop:1275 length:861 start_codon:yes stop_codon:yes gene_type:complete